LWKNKIKKLMNPFKHNVIYKRWLINDLSLDCDVINTLKHTITKLMLTRTFKPPKTKEVENNINKTYFYNDQGVRFKIIKHRKTCFGRGYKTYQASKEFQSLYFQYIAGGHDCFLFIEFDSITWFDYTTINIFYKSYRKNIVVTCASPL